MKPLSAHNLHTKATFPFHSATKKLISGESANSLQFRRRLSGIPRWKSYTKPPRHARRRQRRETLSEIEIPPPPLRAEEICTENSFRSSRERLSGKNTVAFNPEEEKKKKKSAVVVATKLSCVSILLDKSAECGLYCWCRWETDNVYILSLGDMNFEKIEECGFNRAEKVLRDNINKKECR